MSLQIKQAVCEAQTKLQHENTAKAIGTNAWCHFYLPSRIIGQSSRGIFAIYSLVELILRILLYLIMGWAATIMSLTTVTRGLYLLCAQTWTTIGTTAPACLAAYAASSLSVVLGVASDYVDGQQKNGVMGSPMLWQTFAAVQCILTSPTTGYMMVTIPLW